MKMKIAENIRTMRRERKLTQEQLAEAMGVSVGAVSKWESASSIPDIGMIVELANFFDTSVDVLLGYDKSQGSLERTLDRLRKLRRAKDFQLAMAEAEKALKKFPHSFDLVYECAVLFAVAGIEGQSEAAYRRSLELHERALTLLSQNTDPHVGELSIQRDMANLHIALGETDTAIAMLKKTNSRGINNMAIGFALAAVNHEPQEALPYLSDAMMDLALNQLVRLCLGFSYAYLDLGRPEEALYVMEWYVQLVQGMRGAEDVTYLDKLEAGCLAGISTLYAGQKSLDKAKEALGQAIRLIRRFETSPCYTMKGIRFYHGSGTETAYNDQHGTEMEDLYHKITADPHTAEQMKSLWEELMGQGVD